MQSIRDYVVCVCVCASENEQWNCDNDEKRMFNVSIYLLFRVGHIPIMCLFSFDQFHLVSYVCAYA